MESGALQRDTVLIVDDVEINRAILSAIFGQEDRILEAENGQQALEAVIREADRIKAILLDVIMPVMDGFQFLEKMGKLGYLARIPVFIVTAEDSGESIRKSYELGAMDVIRKPVTPYFVQQRINNVVELFHAREQLRHTVSRQDRQLMAQAKEIESLNRSIIETLSTAIEFRSGESGEHVRRIRHLTELMMKQLRLRAYEGCAFSDEEIGRIADASILHDVGKIAIPDSILNKPGKLTPDEYEVIKTHTTKGCEMLEQIPRYHNNELYRYAYDICRHHHERWDGSGYPDGLAGGAIPIWAQVVALADVWDALTNERVYKARFSREKAREMILDGACGAFNPELLKAFCQMYDDNII